MDDYALVLNSGSSSLKFCVYRRPGGEDWSLDSRGQVEGIGTIPRLSARDSGGHLLVDEPEPGVCDCREALRLVAEWLRLTYWGARVVGIGHRVVHGGARYSGPTLVTPPVLAELHRLTPFAPLHQPYNLAAIDAVCEQFPDLPQVACFDTSFHQGQSPIATLIPLPREIRRAGVQRYGFHGLSYEYIASVLPRDAPEIAGGRVVVAHLGSGASLCAMKNRKSVDSSFGFSVLDGLCMGTRPGAMDPGVVLYLFQTLGLSAREVETILYKRSGLLGISGLSNDMRDLLASSEPGARLAVDYFVYRATKEIGAMVAVLGGIDGLVFTAGIGENSAEIRRRICESATWLGIELDATANDEKRRQISTPSSRVSVWVIATDEELMIARYTGQLLGLISAHS